MLSPCLGLKVARLLCIGLCHLAEFCSCSHSQGQPGRSVGWVQPPAGMNLLCVQQSSAVHKCSCTCTLAEEIVTYLAVMVKLDKPIIAVPLKHIKNTGLQTQSLKVSHINISHIFDSIFVVSDRKCWFCYPICEGLVIILQDWPLQCPEYLKDIAFWAYWHFLHTNEAADELREQYSRKAPFHIHADQLNCVLG